MATATPRARAPPYPRPVSPLNVEEIPTCPDTVVYEQLTDEADQEAAERAAKRRRRIRENAEAYLRGDQIYIMTAGLKGPFDKGWNNPWKKRRHQPRTAAEVPETAARPTKTRLAKTAAVQETCAPRTDERECIDLTSDAMDDIEFTQPPTVRDKLPTNIFKRTYDIAGVDRQHLSSLNAKRIEDWLRTSDAYTTDRQPDIRSSPTPAYREYRLPPPDTAAKRPASVGGRNDNTQVGDWATKYNSRDDLEPSSPKPLEDSTQQTHESQNRAEAAILEQKSRSVHRLPPSTSLPAFEYKRAKRPRPKEEAQQLSKTSVNGADPVQIHAEDAPEASKPLSPPPVDVSEQPARSSPKKPALSTETSKTTANNLPSAQVVSVVPAQEGLSNAQSTAELLEPVKPLTEHTMTQRQDSVPVHHSHAPVEECADKEQAAPSCYADNAKAEAGAIGGPLPGDMQTPVRNLDTQALLGDIKPFAISTIKKLEVKLSDAKTPATASKAPPTSRSTARTKRKKKASFAIDAVSEESQSSIKAGFQVRKQQANPSVPASTKIAIAEGIDGNENYDLDPPASNTPADSLPSVSDMFKTTSFPVASKTRGTTQAPKSILKPRSQPALQSSAPPGTTVTATGASIPGTNGTYQSTTTSEKRDAQQPRQLDMFAIENGGGADSQAPELEQFDLDEVVADLGSYLGTWDVEKAAAQASSG